MKLLKFETPGISHYAYLLADGGEAAIVDPRRDIQEYVDAARSIGVRIRYVLETHRQEDFVMGSNAIRQHTGAEIINGTHEIFSYGDRHLEDGEDFELGSLKIVARYTPGHTPESMCWVVYPKEHEDDAWGVFTGDTLFFGDTGRSDLPDQERAVENAGVMYDSVHRALAPLGDATQIFPAHGPGSVCGAGMAERSSSTLGVEKTYNPVFLEDRDRFAKKKGEESKLIPRPPYFRHMERVNLEGGLLPPKGPGTVAVLSPSAFHDAAGDGKIIDIREPEAFAGAHIPDAYSVWLGGLPIFGGWVASHEDAIYLCTDDNAQIERAYRHLTRIGLDDVRGAVGFSKWRGSAQPMRRGGAITPTELRGASGLQILDVREAGEFESGHIDGAKNVYVGHLEEKLGDLGFDKDKPVVVTCGVGHRAGVGVSILLRAGYKDVRNLIGGMKRWSKLEG